MKYPIQSMMISILQCLNVFVMNLWVFAFLLLWTIAGGLVSLPALFVVQWISRWPTEKVMHWFIWIYGRGCNCIIRPFIKLKYINFRKELLPNPGIIIVNHLSFFDTYMLCMLPVYDIHICLRSWPFKMFWYSIFMRMAKYLDFEGLHWDEILKESKEILHRQKRYLLIFPEGHRSRTGKLRRFYSGAFKLATELQVPVFPLCITGTQTLLPPGRWWFKPASIKLQLLDPIYPNQFTGQQAHRQMCRYTNLQMKNMLEQMEPAVV